MKAQAVALDQPCHSAYEKFIEITNHLRGEVLSAGTHSDVEAYLEEDGRELLRLLLQEHLASRGSGRVGEAVCGADGVVRGDVSPNPRKFRHAKSIAYTGYHQESSVNIR